MLQWLVVALLLVSPVFAQESTTPAPAAPSLTIEAIASGSLTGQLPESMQWSPDGTKFSFVQRNETSGNGELWALDPLSGKKALLLGESKLASLAPPASKISDERQREWRGRYGVASYHWSPDSKYLLFDSNGQLWLYSFQTGTGVLATSSPDLVSDPKFSPDGKYISYLRKHDLWIRQVPEGYERQLTKGGDDDLLNGEVDWVYEEELDVRSNYAWSPDSKQIAFLQMNEKTVPTYPIVSYAGIHARAEEQKYPNPGDPNPEVRVGVLDAGSGRARWINLPDTKDAYIPRFGWVKPGVLWVEVLNRAQQKLVLYFVDSNKGDARVALTETSDVWVGERQEIYWFATRDRLLLPSWRDGHTHLYLYSWDKDHPLSGDTKLVAQVTKGDFEVRKVDAVDENAGVAFFTADPNDPRQEQLFSIKLDGTDMKQLSQERGTHEASFGSNTSYYVDKFSALLHPPQLSLCLTSGHCTPFWESKDIAPLHLTAPQELKLKAADGKTMLYAYLYVPLGTMDTSVRFPVLLNPYGGPSGQSVRNEWGGRPFLLQQYLARRGFAVLIVDNRGMANRGRDFNGWLKKKLGDVELADQLAALDQVLKRVPMLDPKKIGWYGASYGGYMTIYAMTHSDRISAGIAIAPVTDWHLYDSIYTERYLGLPRDNEEGYQASSPTNSAANLHGALVIAHGTSDDNVHVQNTVQMTQALIHGAKQFNLMLYPAKTHGISGPDATAHLFHLIEDHFTRTLKLVSMDGGQAQ
jgi:dipeptidyl-peptidase-4